MSATRELRLPEELCNKVEQLYGKRFGGLDKLLLFVLEELARNNDLQTDQAEQRIIEDRLKDLGYI